MALTRKKRRIILLGWGLAGLSLAAILFVYTISDAVTLYKEPAEVQRLIAAGEIDPNRRIKVGGLVVPDSVVHGEGLTLDFVIGDGAGEMPTHFVGVPPDLFEEGQGVIAEGYVRNGRFEAEIILARHDETYVPREVENQLRRNGVWRGEEGGPTAAPPAAPAGGGSTDSGPMDGGSAGSGSADSDSADGGYGY